MFAVIVFTISLSDIREYGVSVKVGVL